MSAKNKATRRIKRKEIQSEDGWTVITHGLSNVSLDESKQDAASAPPQVVKDLTAEKLAAEFKMLQERWEDTALAAQVEEIVTKGKERGWGVKEAVCIGIGSFSRDWAHRWRSLWQLVLFVDVVGRREFFSVERLWRSTLIYSIVKLGDKEMEILCYAQDPAFTPLDTEFLSLLSITTLESGLEAKITSESFVYSPFVDWFLLLPVFLAKRQPVLYVGNEILDDYGIFAQSKEKRERLEECNEIGQKWLEGRQMVRLKEFEKHANALNGMVVYWRDGKEDKEKGDREE